MIDLDLEILEFGFLGSNLKVNLLDYSNFFVVSQFIDYAPIHLLRFILILYATNQMRSTLLINR